MYRLSRPGSDVMEVATDREHIVENAISRSNDQVARLHQGVAVRDLVGVPVQWEVELTRHHTTASV